MAFHGRDRTRIELPSVQSDLLKALHATGKPVVFVNCSGSAIAMPWEVANLPLLCRRGIPANKADAPWPMFCSARSIPAADCPSRSTAPRRSAKI